MTVLRCQRAEGGAGLPEFSPHILVAAFGVLEDWSGEPRVPTGSRCPKVDVDASTLLHRQQRHEDQKATCSKARRNHPVRPQPDSDTQLTLETQTAEGGLKVHFEMRGSINNE